MKLCISLAQNGPKLLEKLGVLVDGRLTRADALRPEHEILGYGITWRIRTPE